MKIVCIIVFLRIVSMCDGFSMHIVAFLVLKRVMCMLEISVIFAAMLFNMIINVITFSCESGYESIFRFVSILF